MVEAQPSEPSLSALAEALRRPHVVFLDGAGQARSRLLENPAVLFTCKDGDGLLSWDNGHEERWSGDPFTRLQKLLHAHPGLVAAGYWSYDLRYHLERLPRCALDDLHLPDCWVGLYPRALDFWSSAESPVVPTPAAPATVSDTVTRAEYEAAVGRVLEYIAAGDCYQVNLSHRFSAAYPGDPVSLYQCLRSISPAPYSAYLDCGDHHVLSSSPELFLRIRDGAVETHPIKGTRPRGATPEEDAASAAELVASAKDRAELLMIVDLERNDLGRVCQYGSVHVPDLYRLESYSNVHHLVATVKGQMRPEVGPLDCLRVAFPGGSITGAPKIRAMEIIEELEPVRRGIYTGAVGWVDGHGNAEWNIAIRTMVLKDGQARFHAGGGIVADSEPAAEYDETLAKASGMLRALGITQ